MKVTIRGTKIDSIEPRGSEPENLHGDLVPGFIDLHVHGAGGSDFMDATPEAVETITRHHALGGTTSLLATTASHPGPRILEALKVIRRCRDEHVGSIEILGAHVEGPYFAVSKKGCHLASAVHPPDKKEWKQFLDTGVVRHMTLAPELPGAEDLIRALTLAGATPAAGHSEATYDQIRRAMDWGLRHVTHLYCAMSGTVKRGPERIAGLLEAALLEENLTTELIADGLHVPQELARLAYKNRSADRMALVSDAMRAVHMPDGEYTFGGLDGSPVKVRQGAALSPDGGGYASSTVTLGDCLRIAVQKHGLPLEEALDRVTKTPAQITGVWDRKGSIEPGKDADLVLLSPEQLPQGTWSLGQKRVG